MARRHPRRARHAAAPTSRVRHALRYRSLQCERLEDRRLLAVLTVDTESDAIDFNDGQMSLREAVFVANTIEGSDEIRFDFGYDDPVTISLVHGEMAITDVLSIVGLGSDRLTIDAQLNSRVFNVSGEAVDLYLSGMTLLNGRTTGDNVSFSEIMQQTHSGGAIRSAAPATLAIDDVVIRGSSVTGDNTSGGAIFASASLVVTNSVISGNSASGRNGLGGGISATRYASITATTLSGNVASRGGGVSISSAGTLLVDRSTFHLNRATDSFAALGGAIYSTGWTMITSSTISGNDVRSTGIDSVAQGAGIWTSGDMIIAHSTIVANTASSLGTGAVGSGGGIYANHAATARLKLDHTIVSGNFATEGPAELRVGDRPLTVRYSLIGDNDGTLLVEAPIGWADTNGNLIGGAIYGFIDPLLDGLEDNGGPTRTHALLPGSPAIFAGDPWRTPGERLPDDDEGEWTPEFDQRGEPFTRRAGTRIDIGAIEYSGRTLIVDALGDVVDDDYGPGKLTLREAIELANESPDFDVIEFATSLLQQRPTTILLTNGELRILQELAIYGPGTRMLTIDGAGNDPTPGAPDWNGAGVFHASANVSFNGLTITGGVSGQGGGIYASKELSLVDVVVVNNKAWVSGGGVWAAGLTLIASRVGNNESYRGTGGVAVNDSLWIDRSVINANRSDFFMPQTIGGISVNFSSSRPTNPEVIVSNSVISGNVGYATGGLNAVSRNFLMYNTLIADNIGRYSGGMTVRSGNELVIQNSSVVRNRGGGMHLTSSWMGALIEDSTISGNISAGIGENSANGSGGGITANGGLTLRRATVTDNTSTSQGSIQAGGGIVARGMLTLEGSIVAANYGILGGDILQAGSGAINVLFSFIGDNRGTALAEVGPDQGSTGSIIGGPVQGARSPRLGPLLDNGSARLPGEFRMPTHLPLPGSLAIDAGAPDDGATPEFDQRGEPYQRVVGNRIDMGAVERQTVGGVANGNFNQDSAVDGADFLAWQRGYGKSNATINDGDGTADGEVDGNDLAVWKNQFGSVFQRAETAATPLLLDAQMMTNDSSSMNAVDAPQSVASGLSRLAGVRLGAIEVATAAGQLHRVDHFTCLETYVAATYLPALSPAKVLDRRVRDAVSFLSSQSTHQVAGSDVLAEATIDEAFALESAWGLPDGWSN